ncbi:MAG: VanW family protein [Tessaracoccus sp.]|uniref:VanW family protein n=1 Tax=Tessaracoccus sp. TaxID=1971211 RepID=UPI001ECB1A69|nr:VanW family protein [Tessaracoccus sp.]MBK7821822.1 VanW family protein [Tessaracoccus sp.]
MKKSGKIAVGVGIGVVAVLGAGYVASYFVAGNQVAAKAAVDGVAIGGLSPAQAREKLVAELGEAAEQPITLKTETASAQIVPADAGLSIDFDKTVTEAGGGFSWNPFEIINTLAGGRETTLVRVVDDAALTSAVQATAGEFAVDPLDGTLAFTDGEIDRTDGVDGVELNVEAATDAVADAFREGQTEVAAPTEATPPAITNAMLDEAVASFAEPVLSGPVTLTLGERSMEIAPKTLAATASFEAVDGKLVGSFDAKALYKATADDRKDLKLKGAKDAGFTLKSGKVVVVPAKTGQTVDRDAFVAAVETAAVATGDARTGELTAVKKKPSFTTEEAEKLAGDFEVIGEYTTYFPHAPYRNTNLSRAAGSVNGTVLMPDEIFSLNDTLGPRTAANGYVDGYVISGGRLVKEAGGGISQSATTLFNAAFFAGFKDIEHKPHSLYFDRYPAGREATVYYGALDLRFQNDTKYPALIQGYVNRSSPGNRGSITFRIWSKRTYDKVVSTDLVKSGFYSGRERVITGDPKCEPQAPIRGFTVTWKRLFYKDGKVVRSEPFSWKYSAGDRIICEKPKQD